MPEPARGQSQPLAETLRPNSLSEVIGQDHLLGEGKPITQLLSQGKLSSIILWGPPGTGKTTIARLMAKEVNANFIALSAIFSGISDLKAVFKDAEKMANIGQKTILFIDEIHRFNKSQQDSFLPYVESGLITLIGATTENPSFELNNALLSRVQVYVLNRLSSDALGKLLLRAEEHSGKNLNLDEKAREVLVAMADGDGRALLNMLEILLSMNFEGEISTDKLAEILVKKLPSYDKSEDGHYNLISALHKSLRGSDPDAALYWFARMLEGGEDPKYIGRRLIRFASEDVGMADPQALPQSIAALEAYERLGSPEGELAIAQAVIYLATAPKSNGIYTAFKNVMKFAAKNGSLMPPKHILNAPTKLMKEQEFGSGYIYDHDTEHGFSGQNYFPDAMPRQKFYKPVERGFERDIIKRLEYWNKLRNRAQG